MTNTDSKNPASRFKITLCMKSAKSAHVVKVILVKQLVFGMSVIIQQKSQIHKKTLKIMLITFSIG